MNKLLKRAAIILIMLAALLGARASQAQTILATTLTQTSPAGCPPSGCAAGQTLDFKVNFGLDPFETLEKPNVQVCVYTPTDWAIEDWYIDSVGAISGTSYQADISHCSDISNYAVHGVTADLSNLFGDILNLRFRIARTAPTNNTGSLVVRIFQHDGAGWTQTDQTFVSVPVTATASNVYAANDAVSCGSFSPCYLNSGSDMENGVGTGFKDAVDAQPANLTILGYYQAKSQTIIIDKPITILGMDDSRITYLGSSCANPVLRITSEVTLRDLTVTDGLCSSPNRDLVTIDSSLPVNLEYIDLLNGLDAVKIAANIGNVTVRFSQALNNTGYAIFRVPGSTGLLHVTGSNLHGNRSGVQVDCGLAGTADHNFWGSGTAATSATSQCAAVDNKRLGAPVLPRDSAAGVYGEKVTVTTGKQSSFGGLISYQRTAEGSDYKLNIVNHGAGAPENVPFTGGSSSSLTACSNYYDVYLEKGETAAGTLNLSLKYDRTSGCTSTIETAAYCTSADTARFPLYWYSPYLTVPTGWNTTGATGQATTCDTTGNEITVAIDSSGRPDFAADLNFTPFVVGLPSQPSSVVITSLSAASGNQQAVIKWTTSSEINTSGFYVLRSTTETGSFERVSSFIPRLGTGTGGASYEFVDTGLTNDTTYYYRLEIISAGLESSFSQVISVLIGQPTRTATVTATVTTTATLTATVTPTGPTPTSTITRTRTVTVTRIATRTRTPIRYATYYIYKSPTSGPSRTLFPTRTPTRTATQDKTSVTSTTSALVTILPLGSSTVSSTQGLSNTQTVSPPGAGYPVASAPAGGTEISQGSPLPSPSATSIVTSSLTITPKPPAQDQADQISEITRRYWPWLLGLLGFEFITLLIAGYWLHRHHLLTFHPDDHMGEPPETLE